MTNTQFDWQEVTFGKTEHINSEDCMGNPERYDRITAWRNKHVIALGFGTNPEQALKDCQRKAQKVLDAEKNIEL